MTYRPAILLLQRLHFFIIRSRTRSREMISHRREPWSRGGSSFTSKTAQFAAPNGKYYLLNLRYPSWFYNVNLKLILLQFQVSSIVVISLFCRIRYYIYCTVAVIVQCASTILSWAGQGERIRTGQSAGSAAVADWPVLIRSPCPA